MSDHYPVEMQIFGKGKNRLFSKLFHISDELFWSYSTGRPFNFF